MCLLNEEVFFNSLMEISSFLFLKYDIPGDVSQLIQYLFHLTYLILIQISCVWTKKNCGLNSKTPDFDIWYIWYEWWSQYISDYLYTVHTEFFIFLKYESKTNGIQKWMIYLKYE